MSNGKAKLPVWTTVAEAYQLVLADLRPVAKVAAVPFAIMTPITMAIPLYPNLAIYSNALVVIAVALFLLWIPFLTKWHRVVLRGPDAEVPRVGFEVGRRELNFLFYEIMVSGVVFSFAAVPAFLYWQNGTSLILFVSVPPFAIALIYVVSRLLLIVPAAALGTDSGLRLAWQQSAGNGWRLFLMVVIAAIPWMAAQMILEAVVDLTGRLVAWAVLVPINFAVAFLSWAVFASCLSLAYLYLVAAASGNDGDASTGPESA